MRTASNILLICLLATIVSCQKMHVQKPGDEILFSAGYSVSAVPASVSPASTKATLFGSDDDFKNKEGQGGYFRVEAFKNVSGTRTSRKHFTAPTTVIYHTDVQNQDPDWYFYNLSDHEKRYWPQTYGLDFLAYMPLERNELTVNNKIDLTEAQRLDPKTYMEFNGYNVADDVEQTVTEGPFFTCTGLPMDETGQNAVKEFIYAWQPNQTYETQQSSQGRVPLMFCHPFSAVNIVIGGAHAGTTIHYIGFKNVYNKGVLDASVCKWTPSDTPGNLNIAVGKTVPDQIQIGHVFGPYQVIPQAHGTTLKIMISYTWRTSEPSYFEYALGGEWIPGKKYTYSIIMGDSAEDIMVDVSVEEWVSGGIDQEIEVK